MTWPNGWTRLLTLAIYGKDMVFYLGRAGLTLTNWGRHGQVGHIWERHGHIWGRFFTLGSSGEGSSLWLGQPYFQYKMYWYSLVHYMEKGGCGLLVWGNTHQTLLERVLLLQKKVTVLSANPLYAPIRILFSLNITSWKLKTSSYINLVNLCLNAVVVLDLVCFMICFLKRLPITSGVFIQSHCRPFLFSFSPPLSRFHSYLISFGT